MRRLEHIALWGGVAAPVLYIVTVLAGGSVLPGYDPMADPISALTAAGRPDIKWMEAGFGLYNLRSWPSQLPGGHWPKVRGDGFS